MTHKIKIKIEHRTIEGLLSSLVGGTAVGAFVSHSWSLGVSAVLLVVVLLITERRDLEDEDEPVRETDGLVLNRSVAVGLWELALRKFSESENPTYVEGLTDGSTIIARHILGMEAEDNG